MTNTAFERNDFVIYRSACSSPVEGIVREVLSGNRYTVEARHILDAAGRRTAGYLGYRYMIDGADLRERHVLAEADSDTTVDLSKLTPLHRKLVAHLARVLEPTGAAL